MKELTITTVSQLEDYYNSGELYTEEWGIVNGKKIWNRKPIWAKPYKEFSFLPFGSKVSLISEFIIGLGMLGESQNTNQKAKELATEYERERLHFEFRKMKKELNLTNYIIADITGLTSDSVKTMTQPNQELPAWAKTMIFVWKKKNLLAS